MHPDHRPYHRFTGKARLEQAVNSLLGLVEGISIDGAINASEIGTLKLWLVDHQDVADRHPFSELVPRVASALADGVLDPEEREDIKWLCERLRSTEFFDMVTADLQRLHTIVGGIASDGVVTVEELRGLSEWIGEHDHLRTCWPYDEIASLTTKVLADGHIDEGEHKLLLGFFSEFMALLDERTIVRPLAFAGPEQRIGALCAVMPEIRFQDATFCFTGASSRHTRAELEDMVRNLGGTALDGVTKKLNYLVIGADGNPCWAFACYGRKVEKAVLLRREGVRLLIVHENDFHDARLDT